MTLTVLLNLWKFNAITHGGCDEQSTSKDCLDAICCYECRFPKEKPSFMIQHFLLIVDVKGLLCSPITITVAKMYISVYTSSSVVKYSLNFLRFELGPVISSRGMIYIPTTYLTPTPSFSIL